jgi:hypothetical protein
LVGCDVQIGRRLSNPSSLLLPGRSVVFATSVADEGGMRV